jgi:molybdate-binding protein
MAQAIAAGQADCGLGIEAAARARGLDFVPLLREHYYLVCLRDALDQPPIITLRRLLQEAPWQEQLARLPGHAPWRSGEVLSLTEQLPWWQLPPKRQRA